VLSKHKKKLPDAAEKASQQINKGADKAADKTREAADNPPDVKGAADKATKKLSSNRNNA